jgi:hypothetical protein
MSTKRVSLVILLSALFLKSSILSQTEQKRTARDLFLLPETPAASKLEPAPEPNYTGMPPKAATPGPLGLRYSLLKQVRDNQVEEVTADTIFHSGDKVRISIESNDSAYLYVIQQGSSGCWKLLFPSKEISGSRSTIEKGAVLQIPAREAWFAFGGSPGVEKIYLFLSRRPEPDLEKMLQRSDKDLDPASLEKATGTIRSEVLSARDLVFEKPTGGRSGDKAGYVVDPTGKAESRVVVDLNLTHR